MKSDSWKIPKDGTKRDLVRGNLVGTLEVKGQTRRGERPRSKEFFKAHRQTRHKATTVEVEGQTFPYRCSAIDQLTNRRLHGS